jgi:hypothetical protein
LVSLLSEFSTQLGAALSYQILENLADEFDEPIPVLMGLCGR